MSLLIVALPLFGFVTALCFGRGLGSRGAAVVTLSCMSVSTLLCLLSFYEIGLSGGSASTFAAPDIRIGETQPLALQGEGGGEGGGGKAVKQVHLSHWFSSTDLFNDAAWGFVFDSLTVVMFCVVTVVSTLVHLYSLSYMKGDPHVPRFLSYLSLFTFFMLLLVSANNFMQMFVGWEGVGLASYLLINFWSTRVQANKSAIKALVVNRVGDLALALSIFMIYSHCSSLDYTTVFTVWNSPCSESSTTLVPFSSLETSPFETSPLKKQKVNLPGFGVIVTGPGAIECICLLLFLGAVGKSAQLGLHTWLPDAMEGPTPVSALIHAATMVTAGVFLIVRCSPLFEQAPLALTVVTCVGGVTALFAATIGLVQNDMKRVIAYSTCSQLGYMCFACGLSQYTIAVFHLVNHAFFKALLFLSAGALIHSRLDEQDLRKMGGFTRVFPYTYSCLILGSLALVGTPFLAGYYSKESLLEVAFARYGVIAHGVYALGSITAFLTAAYSFRLIHLAFYRQPQAGASGGGAGAKLASTASAHEAEGMMVPLSLLALGSLFSGYLLKESFLGAGTDFWEGLSHPPLPLNGSAGGEEGGRQSQALLDSEFVGLLPSDHSGEPPLGPLALSVIGAFLGLLLPNRLNRLTALGSAGAFRHWHDRRGTATAIRQPDGWLWRSGAPGIWLGSEILRFLTKRWYYDKMTNDLAARTGLSFAYQISLKTLDKGVMEVFGPYGLPKLFTQMASALRTLQSGKIPQYAFLILIGLTTAIAVVGSAGGASAASHTTVGFSGGLPVRLLFLCVFISLYTAIAFVGNERLD